MSAQTDKSKRHYRSLNQNWSYQPTLAGRAIIIIKRQKLRDTRNYRNIIKTFFLHFNKIYLVISPFEGSVIVAIV